MHSDTAKWHHEARYFEFEENQIAYWQGGYGKPLLLVHGYPTAAWDWHAVWSTLGQRHSLIACDMLGFGFSDKPRRGYSIHRQADLQEALLAHLGVGEWDALVHDYGDTVGQELLARHCEGSGAAGLGQMILLNGGIFPHLHRPRPVQTLGRSPFGFVLGLMMSRKSFCKNFSEVFGPDTQPSSEELDQFWDLISYNRGNRIAHTLLHYMGDRERHAERWVSVLGKMQDRIGLINGALDPVSGKHAYDHWVNTLPQARAHLLPNVGHYPQVEAPDEVAAKTLDWLEG
jgi:pimeloyl-ACP methyl ester carboxylesterase